MGQVNSVKILLYLCINLLKQVREDTKGQFASELLSCDELRNDSTLIKEALDTLFNIWVENNNADYQAILRIDVRSNGTIIAFCIS